MASPTYRAWVWSAASPLKILLMRMGILFSLPPLMLMPSPPSSCFSTFTPRFWLEMDSGTCSGRSVKAVRTPAGESGGCAPPAPLQNEPLVAVPMPLYAAAPSSQLRTRASSLKFTRTLCQRSRTKTSSSPLRCARPPPPPLGPAAAAAAAAATAIFPAFLKCHVIAKGGKSGEGLRGRPRARGARSARRAGRRQGAGRRSGSSHTRTRRELAAAARPVPLRRILGGVERPKRRRRGRNRGGEKSQLPGAKAQTQGSRGAARRREAGWEEARPRGRAGTRRPADAHLFQPPRPRRPRAARRLRPPPPRSAERRAPQGQLPRAGSPTPPSPRLSTLPFPRAPAPHLCWDRACCRGPRTRRSRPLPSLSYVPLHRPSVLTPSCISIHASSLGLPPTGAWLLLPSSYLSVPCARTLRWTQTEAPGSRKVKREGCPKNSE
uniref:Uncharacterized protein n=1 Tax=Felis catus TaxID=9685 RepID=A0ABI7Z0C1_FELCA